MTHHNPRYSICQIVSPEAINFRPFFIKETFQTLDGLRDRVCDGRFRTVAEADQYINEKLNTGVA